MILWVVTTRLNQLAAFPTCNSSFLTSFFPDSSRTMARRCLRYGILVFECSGRYFL